MTEATTSPAFRPKSLARRSNRAERAVMILSVSEPARIAIRLRKAIRGLLDIAGDESEMPDVRCECTKTACTAIDRLYDSIGHPKRPVSKAGGKHHVDLRTLLDLTPQAPNPVKESTAGLPPDASDQVPTQ